MSNFDILVIDDDDDVIRQLKALLSSKIGDDELHYTFVNDFDLALNFLRNRRYDIVVSDIYVGRETKHKKPGDAEVKADEVVSLIRKSRACPVILITDGLLPERFTGNPFVETVDKSKDLGKSIEAAFVALLSTNIPLITKSLHDELDRFSGSFLWGFLEKNWDRLQSDHLLDKPGLDRVFRRRAAFQLAHVLETSDGEPTERKSADPVDYYIMPPIGDALRLGEMLQSKKDRSFRLVLTPHCHLVVQPNATRPRADYILTLKTVRAEELLGDKKWKDPDKNLISRCAIPARDVGAPDERYCFLPGFLELPDLYCDLMQAEAIQLKSIEADWERVAVLDAPFAEAVQAAYAKLFGTVGLPTINPDRLKHLIGSA